MNVLFGSDPEVGLMIYRLSFDFVIWKKKPRLKKKLIKTKVMFNC